MEANLSVSITPTILKEIDPIIGNDNERREVVMMLAYVMLVLEKVLGVNSIPMIICTCNVKGFYMTFK